MSSSSWTRGAAAASSRKVKQELVRLLFGQKYGRQGPDAHRKLDYSIYSYKELRRAYLQRIQELHPDKLKAANLPTHQLESSKQSFTELQAAWDKYEDIAKMMKKVSNGEQKEDANFTMFGVGCSFSDSPEERAMRDEIMDQASRGWFSSGLLPDRNDSGNNSASSMVDRHKTKLVDDNLFFTAEESSEINNSQTQRRQFDKKKPVRSLIPGLKLR
jgi:curved DNA-binding protein CbpA